MPGNGKRPATEDPKKRKNRVEERCSMGDENLPQPTQTRRKAFAPGMHSK